MNLANKLTILRVLFIPLFLILLLPVGKDSFLIPISPQNGRAIAAVVFALASLTDFLDGYIARKNNCVTNLGKFLDPIADKLLVISALVALTQLGEVSAWPVIIIIAREFIIQGFRILAVNKAVIIPAGMSGKVKTITQIFAVLLILMRNYPFSVFTDLPVGLYLLWISVLLTIYSGYDYIKVNWIRIKG